MPFKIEFSEHFTDKFDCLTELEQSLIEDFVFHFRDFGLKNFIGKVARTDNVPAIDPDRIHKIWWANKQLLWHAHVGYPCWIASRNPYGTYQTSDFLVHFQKFSDTYIALVDYGSHNPFKIPERKMLFRQR
ncbi:hypothetical protein FXN65_10670 [Metapseudomonas lalkuanensis]|uniref:Uncharacterized protein n=1 Tax=Metapseudomonas lalkuanensis TaxID=2604832 RepID=A0A5J6QNW9_9GAMM|nr:hypothetical protein [Pseudomonas lalkuanensis]QEY62516.1 hypothetical protein FXN65_10670 [Pseudomonas lalkuanensis]